MWSNILTNSQLSGNHCSMQYPLYESVKLPLKTLNEPKDLGFVYKSIKINSASEISSRLHYITSLGHFPKFTQIWKEATPLLLHEIPLQENEEAVLQGWSQQRQTGLFTISVILACTLSLKSSLFKIKPFQIKKKSHCPLASSRNIIEMKMSNSRILTVYCYI
jgi:hypothetical protein